MIARPQDLHYLHGQYNDDELPSFFLRHAQAQVLFTAADDHVFHDVIDGVMVNARSSRHDVADLGAIMPKELRRAGRRSAGEDFAKTRDKDFVHTMPASESCNKRVFGDSVLAVFS